jgi:hypothetical protein
MFALVLFGSPGLTSGAFFYVGGIPVVGVWERYAHAPRCLGRDIIMEGHHEQAQCAWDYRWSRVTECGALLASMVAKECGALPRQC